MPSILTHLTYGHSFNIKRMRAICKLKAGSHIASKLIISSIVHVIFNLNKLQALVSIYFNIYISSMPKSSFWHTIFTIEMNNNF